MKPIRLTLSAFGPYETKEVIKFEKLSNHPLYLISGDTGSGKSMIFDGIIYALYGSASGELRSEKMFRCKSAADSAETYVELEFEVAGKRYTVRRKPEYKVAAKNGKLKNSPKKVSLIQPGKETVEHIQEVAAQVQEIIGLNKEQFKQIAMIAQNDFMKLLCASTEERMKIFRDLFSTGKIKTLQDQVKQKAADLKRQNAAALAEIERLRHELPYTEGEEVFDVAVLKERLAHDEKEADRSKEKLEALRKDLQKLSAVEARLQEQASAKRMVEEARARKDEVLKRKPAIDQAIEQNRQLESEREKLIAWIPELENRKARAQALKTIADRLEEAKAKNTQLENQVALAREALENHRNELEKTRKEEQAIENPAAALEKIDQVIESLKESEELRKDLTKNQTGADALKIRLEDMSRLITQARDHAALLEEMLAQNTSAALAAELEEGTPCPVCGSVHHPHPAEFAAETVKKTQVDKARRELKSLETENGKLEASLQATEQAISMLEKSLEKELAKNAASMTMTEALEEKNQLMRTMLKKRTLSEQATRLELAIRKDQDTIELLRSALAVAAADLASAKTRARGLERDTEGMTISEIEAELKEAIGKRKSLEERIAKARADREAFLRELSELDGRIESLKKSADCFDPKALADVEEEMAGKKAAEKEMAAKQEKTCARLMQARLAIETYEKKKAAFEALEETSSRYESLSKCINGALTDPKITLEAWIQASGFDRILARANPRLLQMTNGQYMLVRSENKNSRGQNGLDLDVKDCWNDTIRPIVSLSGGESFMASLSLALGLSEQIQAECGGIHLDTLFVDEGFGTLDSAALNQAILALERLSQENRQVGIISHVESLKNRIEGQILVTKSADGGSHAQLRI